MTRGRRTPLLFAIGSSIVTLFAFAGSAAAFSSGPPDGFAGDPAGGGQSCILCHTSFAENSGDGSLAIDGLPDVFEPGSTYDLSVVLEDLDQTRWGFELTVLDAADQAGGTLVVDDATNTQLSDNAGTDADYLKHTFVGTYDGTADGPVAWTFQWTAPDEPAVSFYIAANAANGDGSSTGDYIYTTVIAIEREDPTPTHNATWSDLKELFD